MWWMPSSCMASSPRSRCTRNYSDKSERSPTVPVDPTGRDLKHFLADDPGGPVVMLNLLRYKEDGKAGYEEYARRIQPFLDDIGAEVLYVGDLSTVLVAPSDHDWDAVLLVRYPSRQSFSSMVADPNYQKITGL